MYYRKTPAVLAIASALMLISACGGSSNNNNTPTDPATTLGISSASVERGDTITLTWSSTDADSCAATGDWSGTKATSGSEMIGPLRKDGSYTLTCSGNNIDDAKTVMVTAGNVTQPTSYLGFPVTLNPTLLAGLTVPDNSISYKGQMARQVLRESAKEAMKGTNVATVTSYIKNDGNTIDDGNILAPTAKNEFIFTETVNNELGTGKNLYGKLFDATKNGTPIDGVDAGDEAYTLGFPGDKDAKAVIDFWLSRFDAEGGKMDPNGYDYRQLIPKYLLGAVFFNESVNHYLDENLELGVKNHDLPYKDGRYYTGKEHSWDEGFGWFGAAAHYGELNAQQNYEVAKKGKGISQTEALMLADKDGNGSVSLYTEYNSGPAYYAASFDKDGNSNYGAVIMADWLEGRTIIANAVDADGVARILNTTERNALKALGANITTEWEKVFAEAVFKYAGETWENISDNGVIADTNAYFGVWSEMKGFMLSLQYGGTHSLITKTHFENIDNLIGYGPVLENGNQVTGIDWTANGGAGEYIVTGGIDVLAYKAKMVDVQNALVALYGITALQHDHRL